jgi:hypothetical protein
MASPCVNPRVALRRAKNGRMVLKKNYRDKKVARGKRCIQRVSGTAAPKRRKSKAAPKKRSARRASSGSRPCPKGSFRVKKGKGKGRCRKLTGAAAAAAAGRPMGFMKKRGVSGAYHSGYRAWAQRAGRA